MDWIKSGKPQGPKTLKNNIVWTPSRYWATIEATDNQELLDLIDDVFRMLFGEGRAARDVARSATDAGWPADFAAWFVTMVKKRGPTITCKPERPFWKNAALVALPWVASAALLALGARAPSTSDWSLPLILVSTLLWAVGLGLIVELKGLDKAWLWISFVPVLGYFTFFWIVIAPSTFRYAEASAQV